MINIDLRDASASKNYVNDEHVMNFARRNICMCLSQIFTKLNFLVFTLRVIVDLRGCLGIKESTTKYTLLAVGALWLILRAIM